MTAKSEANGAPAGRIIGVYIIQIGGNISDHVNVEEVRRQAEKIPGVVVARANPFMCSDPGQELIADDLKKGLVDRVVVASCAPSLHEKTDHRPRFVQRLAVGDRILRHRCC
jgi:heterodisulfide reductase subunit A